MRLTRGPPHRESTACGRAGGGGYYGGGGGGAGVGGSGAGGGGSSAVTARATNQHIGVSSDTTPFVTISYDHSLGVDLDVSPRGRPVSVGQPITLSAKVYRPVQAAPATFLAGRCQRSGLCDPPFEIGTSAVDKEGKAVVTVSDLPAYSCYSFYVSYSGVGDRSFDELGCYDVRADQSTTTTTGTARPTPSSSTTASSEPPPAP